MKLKELFDYLVLNLPGVSVRCSQVWDNDKNCEQRGGFSVTVMGDYFAVQAAETPENFLNRIRDGLAEKIHEKKAQIRVWELMADAQVLKADREFQERKIVDIPAERVMEPGQLTEGGVQ